MPLGTEVDLGPGHIVLDGSQLPAKGAQQLPFFSAHVYCGHGRPSQLLLNPCWYCKYRRRYWCRYFKISDIGSVFGRPFVKQFAHAIGPLSRLPVCLILSVTLVYCGQTVGWIKMKHGVQVGLGPGHVLDGYPLPPPQRDTTPNFQPISVVAKWLDGLRCHLVWRYASAQATLC